MPPAKAAAQSDPSATSLNQDLQPIGSSFENATEPEDVPVLVRAKRGGKRAAATKSRVNADVLAGRIDAEQGAAQFNAATNAKTDRGIFLASEVQLVAEASRFFPSRAPVQPPEGGVASTAPSARLIAEALTQSRLVEGRSTKGRHPC